ncbi:MAG TPA: hypothetical protein VMG60_13485 [Burkholderiaceae bacterium]|nr:hypothetical protein [Burkholderiaceae bacterium]
MGSSRLPGVIVAALLAVLGAGTTAFAQRPPEPPYLPAAAGRAPAQDLTLWRNGHWVHGPHDGQAGWWWVVGAGGAAVWYLYSAPVQPYPDPWASPAGATAPPAAGSTSLPSTRSWYYCESSRTYYPYVATCRGGWTPVPVTAGTDPAPR